MSSSLHDQICCCCPKRVVISGTYKVIGSTTIDKFKAHARGEVNENETRACNTCYKKYTRTQKTKVMHAAAQHLYIISSSPYISIHNQCMAAGAALCNSSLFSSCINVVQKLNQLQILADAALQSQTDQDLEQTYNDKVGWFACVCTQYV